MKKVIVLVLALIMVLNLGVVSAAADVDRIDVTVVGGSIGGAWAAMGEGIAEIIRRDYPSSNTGYEVGQEAANVVLVATGDVELGIGHVNLLNMAINGEQPFPRALENLRVLCILYGDVAEHIFMKKNDKIASIQDIVDQKYPLKVNFNTKDSFMELLGASAFDFYGATADAIKSWGGSVDYMSMGNSIDLMRDGKIEAYSNVIQVPASAVVDAATTLDLQMLSLSDECCNFLNEKFGTYTTVIPAGAYSFVTEDVQTVAASVCLFCSADMPDEEAYAIVNAIYNNFDYFKSIHSSLANVTLEQMAATGSMPLHPGAQKFFDEHK